jgi:Carboxypeptidase regulatory-like domain
MREILLGAALAASLHAAAIRGIVLEHATGRPLARSLVVVQPIAGTQAATQSVRTDSYGAFEFPPLPGGAYLVLASRRSFAPVQYGQKQWKGSGVPVVVEENGTAVLNIRLQRFGAIAGTVLDENDVGLPEHDVVAYRNARPPVLVARGRTDDRGVYRLWGLEPGSYLVRTVGKAYEEGSYLPTFSRETARVDQAHPVEVALDQEAGTVNVRPAPGRLFSIAGRAMVSPVAPVTLTLVSDLGSDTTTSDLQGNFQFKPAPPGSYELYAQAQTDRRYGGGAAAAYQYLSLDRDRTDTRINLGPLPNVRILLEDTKGQAVDSRAVQLLIRRKDLSGEAKPETLRIPQAYAAIAPGRWELALAPTTSYYAAGFSGPNAESADRGRADGWNEILLNGSGQTEVRFVLSSHPGTLHGVVKDAGNPVPGAPVFLEAYDLESRRRLTDVQMTRTDIRGQYNFYGLAPGNYRVLGTFEYQMPDPAAMETARARTVRLDEGQDQVADLDLWVSR